MFEDVHDFGRREPISALEHPNKLSERCHADETGIAGTELVFDETRRLRRLPGIVLRDIADENVGIESNHRRLRRLRSAAPFATAASMSARVTVRRALSSPRSAETGRFGRRTTVPSGC